MPTTLPTPESRVAFLLELHNKAIALMEYMRVGGLPIGALAPYGKGPIAKAWRHYEHGTILDLEGADGSFRSISVSTTGALVGEPLAWSLVREVPEPPLHQKTVESIEAVERAMQLLTRIGQLVAYPDAVEFTGPNFKPDVTGLSDAVNGYTTTIEITPDLRAHLDEYRQLVADTSRPGVLLPTEERRSKLVWRSGQPLEILHRDLREHVLQALRFEAALAMYWKRDFEQGIRRPRDVDHSRSAAMIARLVFWREYPSATTHTEVDRVAHCLASLAREGTAMELDMTPRRYQLARDPLMSDDAPGSAHLDIDGHIVSVAWLRMLPDACALEYLQDGCRLTREASCRALADALGSAVA